VIDTFRVSAFLFYSDAKKEYSHMHTLISFFYYTGTDILSVDDGLAVINKRLRKSLANQGPRCKCATILCNNCSTKGPCVLFNFIKHMFQKVATMNSYMIL
jgi:hypothetical protein